MAAKEVVQLTPKPPLVDQQHQQGGCDDHKGILGASESLCRQLRTVRAKDSGDYVKYGAEYGYEPYK